MFTTDYDDFWYQSHDGLRLYARDYNQVARKKNNAQTILCMHGLTRNSADFEGICHELSADYRLIVADQRGRGRSDYDPNPDNYVPLVYMHDMFLLLQTLNISRVVLLGTSMGGIMAMMMAATRPENIEALIINDIGPEVAPAGLSRIIAEVQTNTSVLLDNWDQAIEQTIKTHQHAFPKLSRAEWSAFAIRLFRENKNEKLILDFDPNIVIPFDQNEGNNLAPDLWSFFRKIIEKPILVIRGQLTDVLSAECVIAMQKIKPDLNTVEVPNVGHAPMLTEEKVLSAIQNFLSQSVSC